jgi:hypothetical protein
LVKVNGNGVEWKKAPNFVNNIQRQDLWKDEKTGATFAIMKGPKGVYIEQSPHGHPHANQFTFNLSGVIESPDGTHTSFSEGNYGFRYVPKNEIHGASSEGMKVLEDFIYIHYWDGPDDWSDPDESSGGTLGFKVNVEEVKWETFPEGWYLTDVQYHVLWKNENTGAMFILIKIPVGGTHELHHTHPQAGQMGFGLSGSLVRNGRLITAGEGNYTFGYPPKGTSHGPPVGSKTEITNEIIILQYFDGPPTKLSEGETTELTLE